MKKFLLVAHWVYAPSLFWRRIEVANARKGKLALRGGVVPKMRNLLRICLQ